MEKTIIITGHYGSGKTNLALNLAIDAVNRGEDTVLCDLDVVNPYFRTADFKTIAGQKGITLLASDYAGSNLDIPALSGGLEAAVLKGGTVIIDAGGDDAGAMALGRYAGVISGKPYSMLYVINRYRYLTKAPDEAARLLTDIEKAARLKATHIANCSNLGSETTARDIIASMPYADTVSGVAGIPVIFTAADSRISKEITGNRDIFPVEIFVKPPWESAIYS